jgi:hypothetical protein
MTSLRFKLLVLGVLLPIVVYVQGCRDPNPVETVSVSLRSTETYLYPTVGGDEDGARISTQAKHFSISAIRRNAETNWVATYVYQPAASFVGSDYAEIEILTGSDGASPPTNIKRVAFHFVIPN